MLHVSVETAPPLVYLCVTYQLISTMLPNLGPWLFRHLAVAPLNRSSRERHHPVDSQPRGAIASILELSPSSPDTASHFARTALRNLRRS